MANRVGQALTNFRDAVVATVKGVSLRDPIRAWLLGEDFNSGTKHIGDPYKQAVYIHTAISILAELIAGVPLNVLDRDETPIDNPGDESVRLLRRPNALNDQRTFFERTTILKARDGQVFWIKPKTFARPLERAVYVVPRREMKAEAPDGLLVGWTRTRRGQREFLELDQVCRLFSVDPDDELGGFAGIRAAQLPIDAHTFAARHNVEVFHHGGQPSSVYVTDQCPSPDQREQLESRLKRYHRGGDKYDTPVILGGGLKRDAVQTNTDLEYIEGQRLTAHQQIAPLHVQPIYAALFENVNYNTAGVQERLQWDLAVLPELKHLLACWNLFAQAFVDPAKTVAADLDSVPVLQGRELERTERILKLQDQGVPLNVLIDVYGLKIPPQPWGDEPLVGAGRMPISVVYDEAAAAIAADNEPEGGGEEGNEATRQRGNKAGDQGLDLAVVREGFEADLSELQTALETHAKADAEARRRRAIHDRWKASYRGLRDRAQMAAKAIIVQQGEEAIRRLRALRLPGGRTADATVHRGKASVEFWVQRILLSVSDRKLTAKLAPLLRGGVELGGTQVGEEVNTPEGWEFNLDAKAVRNHLGFQQIRVRKINDTTRGLIQRVLLEGLDEGMTVNEIGDGIAKTMAVRAGKQTWRIANTEMHEAVAAGRHEGFRQANVKYQAWLTSGRGVEPDGPVRRSHWGAEQATKEKPIKVGERFILSDPETGAKSQCLYPGAGTLPPGERINCSCVTIAKMTAGGRKLALSDYEKRGFVSDAAIRRRLDENSMELVS